MSLITITSFLALTCMFLFLALSSAEPVVDAATLKVVVGTRAKGAIAAATKKSL